VEDALWEHGVRVSRVPLTPARIFDLLQSGRPLSPASGERAG
jgi:hypothetical protein